MLCSAYRLPPHPCAAPRTNEAPSLPRGFLSPQAPNLLNGVEVVTWLRTAHTAHMAFLQKEGVAFAAYQVSRLGADNLPQVLTPTPFWCGFVEEHAERACENSRHLRGREAGGAYRRHACPPDSPKG